MVASHNGGQSVDPRLEPVPRLPALASDGAALATLSTDTAALPTGSAALPTDAARSTGAVGLPAGAAGRDPVGGRIAVLLPCRDEEGTVCGVIDDFRRALPRATIYVYDNASTDRTGAAAAQAGAVVTRVPRPGKGNVLRQMFADIEADVYVVADGDGTYDASAAPALVAALRENNFDMVVGRRVDDGRSGEVYRRGHRAGNQMFTAVVKWIFGNGPEDMLSGYRALSRRYVRSFPATSSGFEIETEMTVHALDLSLPFGEVPTLYRPRPPSSSSKLRTIPDGLRILRCILLLCKEYRPARFFGAIIGALTALAMLASTFRPWDADGALGTGRQVVLGCAVLIFIMLNVGLVLDSVSRSRREMKRVLYLAASDRGGAREPASAG